MRFPPGGSIGGLLVVLAVTADMAAASPHWVGCASCHGAAGEGAEARAAPALAGQSPTYLARQMQAFRTGLRGSHPEDHGGRQMHLMAIALADPAAEASVIERIAMLPAPPVASRTLPGDPRQGEAAYAACAACHGVQGEGDTRTGAPRLDTLQDWYLVGQMRKYRDGVRGASPDDASGSQMAAIAATTSEAQWHDIAAWLAGLQGTPSPD